MTSEDMTFMWPWYDKDIKWVVFNNASDEQKKDW